MYQFRKTVKESLLSGFRSGESLKEHVLKSVYLVVAGVNDISLNFLQKVNSTNPLEYTSHVGLLVDELGNHLKVNQFDFTALKEKRLCKKQRLTSLFYGCFCRTCTN